VGVSYYAKKVDRGNPVLYDVLVWVSHLLRD